MRINLSNDHWVEIRENLTRADRRAVLGALEFAVEDGHTVIPGNLAELQMTALLGQVITEWSFPGKPVPSQNIGGTLVLDDVLSLEDSNVLEEAVRPLFEKVVPPNPRSRSSRQNG